MRRVGRPQQDPRAGRTARRHSARPRRRGAADA